MGQRLLQDGVRQHSNIHSRKALFFTNANTEFAEIFSDQAEWFASQKGTYDSASYCSLDRCSVGCAFWDETVGGCASAAVKAAIINRCCTGSFQNKTRGMRSNGRQLNQLVLEVSGTSNGGIRMKKIMLWINGFP
jgi:hypothetical protein